MHRNRLAIRADLVGSLQYITPRSPREIYGKAWVQEAEEKDCRTRGMELFSLRDGR